MEESSMKTKTFEFNGKTIDFEINDKNVMVNATQMAAVFGKNVKDFMKNETTKAFVNECLKRENSPFLKVFSQSDFKGFFTIGFILFSAAKGDVYAPCLSPQVCRLVESCI